MCIFVISIEFKSLKWSVKNDALTLYLLYDILYHNIQCTVWCIVYNYVLSVAYMHAVLLYSWYDIYMYHNIHCMAYTVPQYWLCDIYCTVQWYIVYRYIHDILYLYIHVEIYAVYCTTVLFVSKTTCAVNEATKLIHHNKISQEQLNFFQNLLYLYHKRKKFHF